jgi:RNA polymerase sigma factor (sigma-70 family)
MATSSSPYHSDLSWLLPNREEFSRLEPRIRMAVSKAWPGCCEVSQAVLKEAEPPGELWEKAIRRLVIELQERPESGDDAQLLCRFFELSVRKCKAEQKADARRFIVLPDLADKTDLEAAVQAKVDLATVIEEMTAEDREILLLRHLRHQTYKEVAAQKGLSDKAAQKRCERAINKLRQKFGRHLSL